MDTQAARTFVADILAPEIRMLWHTGRESVRSWVPANHWDEGAKVLGHGLDYPEDNSHCFCELTLPSIGPVILMYDDIGEPSFVLWEAEDHPSLGNGDHPLPGLPVSMYVHCAEQVEAHFEHLRDLQRSLEEAC